MLLAVLVGIPALLMMAASVVYPQPLMVVGAMSIGQGLGVLALLCYLAAIVTEVRRKAGSEPADGQRGTKEDGDQVEVSIAFDQTRQ